MKEKLKQIPQKFKESKVTTTNNYKPTNQTTYLRNG